MAHRIGVCSWSLKPAGPEDLAAKVDACGVRAVQLALDPIRTGQWELKETLGALDALGIELISGMMAMAGEDYSTLESIRRTGGLRPEATWPANLQAAKTNAIIARELGLSLVTFHAGFLPHDATDPERETMIERLERIEETFGGCGVGVALETGQETADTLLEVLDELPRVGVNFDPANMILYGMGDPVEAFRKLGRRVSQVHVKDALPADRAGQWGREVLVGEGAVDWKPFLAAVHDADPELDLVIEREAGEDRAEEVMRAREVIRHALG